MSSILLKNGTLVTSEGIQTSDMLIENRRIGKIGLKLSGNDKTRIIDCQGKTIFPGFIDMHVHLREPGQEEKESLFTGLSAAVQGGITAVCTMPNTSPAIDNQFLVKFLLDKAWEINQARLYPMGSITKGLKGESLSEMASMVRAGAVAFSDDGAPVENMLVLRRALQYLNPYKKPLILHCENRILANNGSMNEGVISIQLGLSGYHSAAEEASLAESIEVAKYFGPIHIAHVSTKTSVELIRFAKQRGIQITAETAPHYFMLTEDDVRGYNVNAKMSPPLRTEADRLAIIEGLRDGTLDAIATDHAPHTVDDKNCEFERAAFGIVGLETGLMLTMQKLVHEEGFSLERIAQLWSANPAKILSLPGGHIRKGQCADLTIVDMEKAWEVRPSTFVSKSKNTPFEGFEGKGCAVMTLVDGKIVWESKV